MAKQLLIDNPQDAMIIGGRIRAARTWAKLTAYDIGFFLGVDQNRMGQMEKGERINAGIVKQLAVYLCQDESFFYGKGPLKPLDEAKRNGMFRHDASRGFAKYLQSDGVREKFMSRPNDKR